MSKRTGIGIKRLIISGNKRAEFGCIVTYSNGMSKHFTGKGSLKEAAKVADEYEEKIVTISTPDTIYRDLQGTRRSIIQITRRTQDMLIVPERRMLAAIKRLDLFGGIRT